MIVHIKGLSSGLEMTFTDADQFVKLFGYKNTLQNCYATTVTKELIFLASNFAGFNSNFFIDSFSDKGAGEIGNVWRGNSLGSRIISWNFINSYKSNGTYSPAALLNALVNNPQEIIEVTVNNEYKCNFHFISDTSTEEGILALESADVNKGAFWSKGQQTFEFLLFNSIENYIPKLMPKVLLDEINYPMQIRLTSETAQNPKITIGGNQNGKYDSWKLTTPNQTLVFNNEIFQDDFIIIDSENLTIVNEHGEDRLNDVFETSGSGDKFPKIITGINNWELQVNNTDNYYDLIESVASDFRIEVTYEILSSIVGEYV